MSTNFLPATLSIPLESANFPSSYNFGSNSLRFSWDDLLWAALTVGRPNTAHVFRYGNASLHEALFRISLVRMALEETLVHSRFKRLNRTDAFQALDTTEKGAVSYFLGMTVCKLFASRLLNAPWLLHLDVFRHRLNPKLFAGRSRPDLVGEDATGSWHAFETKGRSSIPSSADKQKAKDQAQRLVSVNGTKCLLHIGSIAFFRQDELEFYWCDPKPENPDVIEIEIMENDWKNYYAPAWALMSEHGREFLLAHDLVINIHDKVHKQLLEGQWAKARLIAIELRKEFEANGYQPDGLRIIVGESWQQPFHKMVGS